MQGAGAAPLPAGGPRCACEVAAEQKARTTYENLLLQADDPDVIDVLRYLRQREIVHYQRFAEGIEMVKDQLDAKNFYAVNISLPLEDNCSDGCKRKQCACSD
ncbi:MAG: manganese catalase family protein [Clostridia bacterium]|nr:manganese catalase family protein [Clostridia bacterium]